MRKFLTLIYNRIFNRNKRFIVWSNSSQYKIHWIDKGYSDEATFFYRIIYYPYRTNKYEIEYHPNMIHHWPMKKRKATEHPFYQTVLKKLQEFQREELIGLITLPDITGVKQ